MKKLIERIKREISCFKSGKSKAGASQNDKIRFFLLDKHNCVYLRIMFHVKQKTWKQKT